LYFLASFVYIIGHIVSELCKKELNYVD